MNAINECNQRMQSTNAINPQCPSRRKRLPTLFPFPRSRARAHPGISARCPPRCRKGVLLLLLLLLPVIALPCTLPSTHALAGLKRPPCMMSLTVRRPPLWEGSMAGSEAWPASPAWPAWPPSPAVPCACDAAAATVLSMSRGGTGAADDDDEGAAAAAADGALVAPSAVRGEVSD